MPNAPSSTYRLQFNAAFTFEDAARIVPYLRDLGITHVYSSPYLQAAPGSMHGYDVIDHFKVSDEVGGEEGLKSLQKRLQENGLGQILDIVPNHMAIGAGNRCWWDVLENGPSSPYASWFDIDWHSNEIKLQNKVLIPVLGDQYGRVLMAGQINVGFEDHVFLFRYMEHTFPLSPRSAASILSATASHIHHDTLGFLADSLVRLPSLDSTDPVLIQERHRDKEAVYSLLTRLCLEDTDTCASIEATVKNINSDADALDDLLNLQNYRLAYWRTADQELGYRRFFDVNTLIGLRMERSHVFDATHHRILQWLQEGTLNGFRIDHPDGLRDPQQYFARLRGRAPEAWIVAEKILETGEFLRSTWPIEGTTGYDFMNICNRLLVDSKGLSEFASIYSEFVPQRDGFDVIAHDRKLNVEHDALGSDVNRLANIFVSICENNRDRRDYTRAEIRRAIREVAASFRIYRTYVVAERNEISEEDTREIDFAILAAWNTRQDIDRGLFDFMADVLSLRQRGALESEFLLRFQQFTSPVMAKGVEDTAFYCFNRMVGLNEVGGAPDLGGISVAEFHEYCQFMQSTHPATMTTLSTHDTKRSDDVRARLAALTELPGKWKSACTRWSRMNAGFKTNGLPDRNTEYFLYQTLIGAWPISLERILPYMQKAVREAKEQTNWTQQDAEFEGALRDFIERALASNSFVADLEVMVAKVSGSGQINSLSQTLLKCTAPGVPDLYQGGELWDYRLVDPDNRTPVDYSLRRSMLDALKSGTTPEEILKNSSSGMPKLWLIHRALTLRSAHPDWFDAGAGYFPITTNGPKAEHAISFLRGENVAVIARRLPVKLGDSWSGTTLDLPQGRWQNLLTGEVLDGGRIRIQRLLQRFPVGLLQKEWN